VYERKFKGARIQGLKNGLKNWFFAGREKKKGLSGVVF
jgi:hypothetical protein